MTSKEAIQKILNREDPGRFVYAPNMWQWFTHRQNMNEYPPELKDCTSQLEAIRVLGLEVFSRNVYSNPYDYWFGGLNRRIFDAVEVEKLVEIRGKDTVTTLRYKMNKGVLEERLRYIHSESTLVQEKFLIDKPETQLDLFEEFLERTSYRFLSKRFDQTAEEIGSDGIAVAGEFFSPLKMLHLYLGPVETTYLLNDEEDRMKRLMALHEKNQLCLLKEMMEHNIPAVMSMDNLDTMFHPPRYVEEYSASFYEKASTLCHEHDSRFFIHACGQQRANLKLISSLGVDGLEGVAYPPLGDIELEEAMEMTGDNFIITGGISASETTTFKTRDEVFSYMENLLTRMKPYRHRFILSASCNTAIETPWEILKLFRDAWVEMGQ
ncbi:hypothetical protein EXM22_16915 [Oceanispirochaeta crateris]|uniref:Uroporphyrinogen decarboxylase (URO-D) domain-containing protein n=1 Tax=Oceanispirochaeta crateris TaxID=2518645 RepID=A0A5C1QQS4_9SPIO|nr:uroporphyrinogen decarboxylase family protein [Oceanispirochaeta crateris]QEN09579.1 hypothetical protein EXM22_16915 [Oceanispirochaeta crateris]